MAIELVVEENTYVTLEEADAYFSKYGNAEWTGTDDARAQALVSATQAIDALYGSKFMGIMYSESQPLLFPRQSFNDKDGRYVSGIPAALKNATCEIALMAVTGADIFPEASNSNNVRSEQVQVGALSISNEYFKAPQGVSFDGFRKIDLLLRPLLKSATRAWSITG